ncbi:MAG: transporter [Butyricicoccus sp.]
MQKNPIYQKINRFLSRSAVYVEIALSCIIIAVIMVMTVGLVLNLLQGDLLHMDDENFREFLSSALTLVVGMEFVKMLCMHSAESMIDVLLFATARQMVVEHLGAVDTLITVFAIAVLFVIRKFLFVTKASGGKQKKAFDEEKRQGEEST